MLPVELHIIQRTIEQVESAEAKLRSLTSQKSLSSRRKAVLAERYVIDAQRIADALKSGYPPSQWNDAISSLGLSQRWFAEDAQIAS